MKEYQSLLAIILAVFGLLLVGAIFSPSFSEQKSYLDLFMLFGSLLFVFSVLVIAAVLGFGSFALFLAILLGAIMIFAGIEAAFLAVLIVYTLWGLIFIMQLLLFDNHIASAKEWFMSRYNQQTFKIEFYAFYPLLGIVYVLLEFVPHIIYKDSLLKFAPQEIYLKMQDFLATKKR